MPDPGSAIAGVVEALLKEGPQIVKDVHSWVFDPTSFPGADFDSGKMFSDDDKLQKVADNAEAGNEEGSSVVVTSSPSDTYTYKITLGRKSGLKDPSGLTDNSTTGWRIKIPLKLQVTMTKVKFVYKNSEGQVEGDADEEEMIDQVVLSSGTHMKFYTYAIRSGELAAKLQDVYQGGKHGFDLHLDLQSLVGWMSKDPSPSAYDIHITPDGSATIEGGNSALE